MALIVMILTVVISLSAGLATVNPSDLQEPFWAVTVASLIVPSILITLGIGLMFDRLWSGRRLVHIRYGGASNSDLPFGF